MEITAVQEQTVEEAQNVLFTETPVPSTCKCIVHREGSGIVKLRGITKNQCRARFLVEYNANITLPTTGVNGEISLSISLDGEPIPSSLGATYPGAAGRYFNVSGLAYIDVPSGCCATISVKNTSTQPIVVRNANLVVSRVA